VTCPNGRFPTIQGTGEEGQKLPSSGDRGPRKKARFKKKKEKESGDFYTGTLGKKSAKGAGLGGGIEAIKGSDWGSNRESLSGKRWGTKGRGREKGRKGNRKGGQEQV